MGHFVCMNVYIYIQLSIHILYIHIYTYIYHAMYLYTHPCTIGDVAWCCHIGWQVFFGTDLRFFRAQKKHNSTRSLVRSGDYAWWQLGVSIVMGLPQNVKIPFFDGWLGVLPWLRWFCTGILGFVEYGLAYLSNGPPTPWGIYRDYVFFFSGGPEANLSVFL